MRRASVAWAPIVLALVIAVPPARAQNAEDVRGAIETTERAIERARAVADRDGDPSAAEHVAQAEQLQDRARRAFDAGLFGDALRLTRAARERIEFLATPRPRGSPARVREEMQRTDELIDRLAPLVENTPAPVGRRLLDEAVRLQHEAREALESERHGQAGELTLRARQTALRALRLAEGPPGRVPERARTMVEQTRALLDDSDWLVGAGEKAARAYRDARASVEAAAEELQAGRPRQAVRRAQEARGRLLDALQVADRKIVREAAVDAVRSSAERLEAARTRASAGRRAERVLAAAADRQRSAERYLELGRLPASLAEVRAVSAILDRAGL
jgi:hypothetical protein